MLALKMDCYSSRTLYILLYYYNNLYIGTMQIIIFRRTFPPFNKKNTKNGLNHRNKDSVVYMEGL